MVITIYIYHKGLRLNKAHILHRVIIGLLSLTAILIVAKAGTMATDGFRMQKISPTEEHLKPYYSDNISLFDKNIFDQPFEYLGKGAQIYCFASHDGEYVLKLLRHHKYRSPFWSRLLSFSPIVDKYLKENNEYRKSIYQRALKSYKMAATDLKQASGTVYVHLKKTDLLQTKAKIIDKAKQSHYIDLDNRFFIIQKKAKRTLSEALIEKKELNDLEGAKALVDSFLSSITHMMENQITIRDRNCLVNFGESNNQVQMIDLGAFIPFEEGKDFSRLEKKTISITKHLQRWLTKKFPELVPYVHEEMNSQLLSIKHDREQNKHKVM